MAVGRPLDADPGRDVGTLVSAVQMVIAEARGLHTTTSSSRSHISISARLDSAIRTQCRGPFVPVCLGQAIDAGHLEESQRRPGASQLPEKV